MSNFAPTPDKKFTFGLWTIGNVGRDPFGLPTREPISPFDVVRVIAEVGAYGVNFHDNDLIPIDATPAEYDRLVSEFRAVMAETGIRMPMATCNLFTDPAFKDGAFTSNDHRVRAYALQKVLRTLDTAMELGAEVFVFWGGREGTESDATKSPLDGVKRYREAINFVTHYAVDRGYNIRFALEAKPNEPRGDIYLPTTGAMLGFIATLDHPHMVGVNPEVAHEHMAGLNFVHAIAQAWDAGKLFHIDLNDQMFGRYDQDFRFGSVMLKQNFFLVKFLEDVGYSGSRHFDAHAFRTEDLAGVKDFARGCMRTYMIFAERAARWNADPEIQALLAEINADDGSTDYMKGGYTADAAAALKGAQFDRVALGARGLAYERLDQLTVEVLLGVR
jgi:xylose isomerase